MKTLMLLFFTLCSSHAIKTHDVALAVFHLFDTDEQLTLEVRFEIDHFLKLKNLKEEQITQQNINDYITSTNRWEINNKEVVLELISVRKDNGHYRINYNLGKLHSKIKTIAISNTFFMHLKTHSNIIMLDVNERFRDFNMNKNKQNIQIEY